MVADRSKPTVESCEAYCRECSWVKLRGEAGLVHVQELVRYHVATYGHRVVVRAVKVTVYRPLGAYPPPA